MYFLRLQHVRSTHSEDTRVSRVVLVTSAFIVSSSDLLSLFFGHSEYEIARAPQCVNHFISNRGDKIRDNVEEKKKKEKSRCLDSKAIL